MSGAHLRVHLAQPQPARDGGFTIPITVYRDGRGNDAWQEISDLARDRGAFRVTDDQGRPMSVYVEPLRTEDREQSLHAQLRLRPQFTPGVKREPQRPSKLVWDVPVEVRDIVIPVEFKDLELP